MHTLEHNQLLEEINRKYPIVKHSNNYAYGDRYILSKYCRLKDIPDFFNGEWQHGNIGPERNFHAEFIIGSDGLSHLRKGSRFYVAREDQVEFLKTQGYTNVFAVGLPIVYVKKRKVERIKKSLLVMPMHTLSDTKEAFNFQAYVSYINSIKKDFDFICCCLHKACFEKGYWMNEFRSIGVDVVLGADPDDINSLDRLGHLFSAFEYVTSNAYGSHAAYAAYFGAKFSINGPKPSFNKSDYAETTFYKNAPELLDILQEWHDTDYYSKIYSFLYTNPSDAIIAIDWAREQLGLDFKKSPYKLSILLGWKLSFWKRLQSLIKRSFTFPKK
jgi:hypothetical protein